MARLAAVLDQNARQVADLIIVVAGSAGRTTSQEMAREFARVRAGHIRHKGD